MRKYYTPYGEASVGPDYVTVTANSAQLYAWAHRPGYSWPCSTLEDLDSIEVDLDDNGLVDIAPREAYEADLDGSELSAWLSDVLRETLPKDHPCWFVTVGQFEEN